MTHLARWHIERFGHFAQTEHPPLGPGLNVLMGPNEAGKSTLLAFLTWVLFGPKGAPAHQAPLARDAGGTLWFSDGDRQWSVARRGRQVDVLGPEKQRVAVEALLGSVDRALFRTVLAFDLGDLRDLGDLSDDALRQRLFAAGLTGGGRSVRDVRQELDQEMKALRRPRASSRITDLLQRMRQLRADHKEATDQARRLPERRRQLDELRQHHDEARERSSALAAEIARLDALSKAWPHALAAREAADALATLGTPLLDDAAWAAIEAAGTALDALVTRLSDAERDLGAARGRLEQLDPRDVVLDHEPALQALQERLPDLQADLRALDGAPAEARRAGEELARLLVDLGLPDASRLDALRIPSDRRDRLAEDGLRLAEARRRLEAEETQRARREQEIEQDVASVDADLGDLARDPVAAARADEVRDLERRWRVEVAPLEADRRLARKEADAARVSAEKRLAALGARAPADLPALAPDDVRKLLDGARAASRGLDDATRQEATSADAARRAREAWQGAAKDLAAVPAPGPHLALAAEIRKLQVRAEAALAARTRAEAATEQALAQHQTRRRHEATLGTPSDGLPGTPLPQRDLQALASLCATVRTEVTSERNAHDDLARLPPVEGRAPSDEDVARLRQRVTDLAAARGLFEDASRPGDAGARRPVITVIGAIALGLLGLLAVIVALVVPKLALLALLGALLLLAALAVAVGAAWLGTSPAGADPTTAARLRDALRALGLPETAGSAEVRAAEAQAGQDLAAASSTLEAHRAWTAAASRLAERQRRVESARAALAKWLAQHRLPADLDAESAERWVATLADALRARDDGDAARAIAGRERATWDAFASDARRTLERLGVTAGDDGLSEAIAKALTALEEQERHARTRAERAERASAREAEHLAADERLRLASEALSAARAAATAREAEARALGVPVALPAVPAWLEALREALRAVEAAEERERRATDLEAAATAWHAQARTLRDALGATEDDLAPLAARCARATEAEDRARQLTLRRAGLAQDRAALERRAVGLAAERQELDDATLAWQALRAQAGLPEGVAPDRVAAFLATLDRAHEASARAATATERAQAAGSSRDAFFAEVRALCAAVGAPAPSDARAALLRVHELGTRRAEARELEVERRARREAVADLEPVVADLTARRAAAEGALGAMLLEVGVPDVDEARAAWQRHRRRRELEDDLRRARRTVEEHLGHDAALDGGDPLAWQARRDVASGERATAEAEREELSKRLGVEEKAYDDLLERADVAQLDGELESVGHELRAATRDYARLQLSDHLLDAALDRFRQDKQPQVLRRASELWSIVTGGSWTTVRPALEEDDLEVLDDDGFVTRAAALSRGTAEQLYLCLRLALAEALAEGGSVRLPLVLDDVLVNFDDERAVAAAKVLHEVSRTRQVLLFACRAHTLELLLAAGAEPNVIPLPRFAGAQSPVVLTFEAPVPAMPAPRASTELAEVEDRIVEVLAKADRPLARGDIVLQLGLDDPTWLKAARSLVQSGLVVQTGAKRGTRYALADRSPDVE